MEEIFEIVKAVNRMKEKIAELATKIDLVLKTTPLQDVNPPDQYVEEETACRILHCCPRTLAKHRSEGSIPFIKNGKKILYLTSDLHQFLERIKNN
jgi:hypothetical protein